ncbi:MAG: hypothetical protein CMK83_13525 [Pseudomonadales bacterium]|jgi:hypothetical protein|uniref:hypothetical protein n=1 Tax=unclassified Ketobacter TaxID=2639109 RepID=UPI000C3FE31A|nr:MULTISPECIES: hypothetical protein [unclassified Ketobacter]MAQ25223.1 hypothetical protein [Pseudomonadales bacterium]MEC8812676.1 hypothetical protein [Pseudomonadota bacterium]TNC88002.1 MAG: hypothetical protein CSH49_13365 [Alcanivorax sp.]HAG94383.1 hypothetical protein [Gammaproteobacteria bacterium]MBI27919.1 hypothetical protein [Pseudomonadales bacterium]
MRNPNKLSHCALILFMSMASSLALASGSDAVGHAQTGDKANYNLGKRVFAVKIACESCSMPGFDLNKSSAQELLQKLPQADLTSREQEAVSVYLKRRFKL